MNEKFAHTAGAWTVGTSSDNGIHCVDAIDPHRPGIIEICEVWGTYSDTEKDDMSLANARLIAAAPELLESLQDLKCELILSNVDSDYIESHFRKVIDKAEAAIAKATGDRLGEMAAIDRIAKATGKTSEAA